ncbi:uncharacterized protein V1513DRAFT_445566 [Lipomyces chichibuensis]|uniref:uncharacterized protein n=1 Tax=Lipomyces chichibuensis TaxID=1546026 RepID=UPI0033438BCD
MFTANTYKVDTEAEPIRLADISEMSVTDTKALSNYNEAFTLLKEDTPEQRLDVQLPYEKFLQLDDAFSKLQLAEGISEDQRYLSLAYHSVAQTVTVVTCLSSIHAGAVSWIYYGIFAYVEDYLSTRSPHTVENIQLVGSATQYFTHGEYGRSRKEPDGAFMYKTMTGIGELVIAIEVGTSETYDKLLEDKDMWIEGMRVNVFILICFKESTLFKDPDAQCRRRRWQWHKALLKPLKRTPG